MRPKHYLFILAMIVFYGPLFGQSDASPNYLDRAQLFEGQAQEFAERGNALIIVGNSYVAMIDKIFSEGNIKVEGTSNRETRRRQSQLDWMKNVAPLFVSTVENKKELNQKISACVAEFGEAFGLSNENRNSIEKHLAGYADAYGKYTAAYYELIRGLNNGKIPAPALPPPPPPVQQHHRH